MTWWVAPALLAGALLAPGSTAAAPEREVSLSVAGGYRVYNEPLGLSDDAAILFRVGLGLSSRAQLAIDYLYSDPVPIRGAQTDAAGTVRFLVQPGHAYTVRVYPVPGVTQEGWWSPVIAGGDSTFDLLVDPPGTPAGRRLAP